MRDIGRNAVLGSFTTAGGSLLGFVLRFGMNALLARFIAPEEFGIYAQASVYAAVVCLLGAFSFPQALVQLPEMPGIAATVRRLTAVSSGAIVLIGATLWPILSATRGDAIAHCFMALLFSAALSAYGQTFEAELLREHRWHAAAGLRLGANVATIGIVVPIGLLAPGPFVLVLRDALAPILVMGVIVLVRWRKGHVASKYDPTTARAVWTLGKALFWNRGLEVILHKVDSALVGELLGQRTLGFYDQARYLAALPGALVAPISNTVGLRLLSSLHDDPLRRKRAFALLQWGIARLVFVFSLGSLLAPELAIRVLYGPAWSESAPILQVLAVWCALVPISGNHVILLTALRDWRPVRIGLVTAILVLVPSLAALIPLWSALGAALASTLAVAAELVVRARATGVHLGVSGRSQLRQALPLLLGLAVGVGSGALVRGIAPATWWGQALGLVVGLTAAGLTLLAVEGRHARTELRYLRDVIRRRT